ncbi:helicase associated domain-containing protein, partial [Pseudomonadales bacterium]|nr:helicase associated domain-containing protein [Pseudomonadales bacterium]
ELDDSFTSNYFLLNEYSKKFNHCNPKQKEVFQGRKVGAILDNFRKRKKEGRLSIGQVDQLNSINFVWDPLESQWMENYEVLKSFKREQGHANPKQKEEYKGVKVGVWLTKQRQNYHGKGGKTGHFKLDGHKIQLLEAIGVDWEPLKR